MNDPKEGRKLPALKAEKFDEQIEKLKEQIKQQTENLRIKREKIEELKGKDNTEPEIQRLQQELEREINEVHVKNTSIKELHEGRDAELARLQHNIDQKIRDTELLTNPTSTEPSGTQHARRDPFTGKIQHGRTKTEMIKDPNFVGFVNDKPIFKNPEDVPAGAVVEELSDLSEKEQEDLGDKESQINEFSFSPFLARTE